jgi:hypothetical protein
MNDTLVAEVEQLETHLTQRLGGRVYGLRLTLSENGIVLQGFAHTYYVKQLAQHELLKATWLPLAANDIKVA